jgi:hypothetical protein
VKNVYNGGEFKELFRGITEPCIRSVYFLQKKEQDEVAAGPVSENTQTSLTMTYKSRRQGRARSS